MLYRSGNRINDLRKYYNMKFSKFQDAIEASPMSDGVNELATQQGFEAVKDSIDVRKVIKKLSDELLVLALVASRTGLSLDYIADVAIETANHKNAEGNENAN